MTRNRNPVSFAPLVASVSILLICGTVLASTKPTSPCFRPPLPERIKLAEGIANAAAGNKVGVLMLALEALDATGE